MTQLSIVVRTVRDQLKFYHVRHEEVASLAAAGYTNLTVKSAWHQIVGLV